MWMNHFTFPRNCLFRLSAPSVTQLLLHSSLLPFPHLLSSCLTLSLTFPVPPYTTQSLATYPDFLSQISVTSFSAAPWLLPFGKSPAILPQHPRSSLKWKKGGSHPQPRQGPKSFARVPAISSRPRNWLSPPCPSWHPAPAQPPPPTPQPPPSAPRSEAPE